MRCENERTCVLHSTVLLKSSLIFKFFFCHFVHASNVVINFIPSLYTILCAIDRKKVPIQCKNNVSYGVFSLTVVLLSGRSGRAYYPVGVLCPTPDNLVDEQRWHRRVDGVGSTAFFGRWNAMPGRRAAAALNGVRNGQLLNGRELRAPIYSQSPG